MRAAGESLLFAILVFVFASSTIPVNAYPANPAPMTLYQPDGTAFQARMVGDEFARGYVTVDGYYSIDQAEDGYWYYIDGATGSKTSRVGIGAPGMNDNKGLYIPPELASNVNDRRNAFNAQLSGASFQRPAGLNLLINTTGTVSFPVILIRFTDVPPSNYSRAQIQDHYFGTHPPTATGPGSLHDFYDEASYGQLNLTGRAYGWYNSTRDSAYYDYRNGRAYPQLITEAVALADNDVNFSEYDSNHDGYVDNLVVVMCGLAHDGPGGCCNMGSSYIETNDNYTSTQKIRIWCFFAVGELDFWSGRPNVLLQCGPVAHEFAHVFSIGDLYDYNSSDGDGINAGVGAWDILGDGCWNYVDIFGDCPAGLCAWAKACLGWITPERVMDNRSITVPPFETNATAYQLLDNPDGYEGRFAVQPGTGEYFIVENRRKIGFDQSLPGEGLLIWHINEANTVNGNQHYSTRLVALEHADGHLFSNDASDPWYAPAHSAFNATTSPNSTLSNGSPSGVEVTGISTLPSSKSTPMTAYVVVPARNLTEWDESQASAMLAGEDIPNTIMVGHQYDGTITFRNTGPEAWTEDKLVRMLVWGSTAELGIHGDAYNYGCGYEEFCIPAGTSIQPGETYTWNFSFVPTTAGYTCIGLTMAHNRLNGTVTGFGQPDFESILVTPSNFTGDLGNAWYQSNSVPSAMHVGQTYNVSVTYMNDGWAPWSEAGSVRLLAFGDTAPMGMVSDCDNYGSGYPEYAIQDGKYVLLWQLHTWNFTVTPTAPGNYMVGFAMVQNSGSTVTPFGGFGYATVTVD